MSDSKTLRERKADALLDTLVAFSSEYPNSPGVVVIAVTGIGACRRVTAAWDRGSVPGRWHSTASSESTTLVGALESAVDLETLMRSAQKAQKEGRR